MELKEAINLRQSTRDFDDRPVPEDKLLRVLEAARLAPSASNRQPRRFVVVRDAETRQALSRAAGGQAHVAQAPVVIACVATMPDYVMRCGVPSYPIDIAIAVDHMTLAAVEEGLGTCWVGGFWQEPARAALKVPDNYRVVILMPLGYPRQELRPKLRKSLDEVVCRETFRE